MFKKFLKKQILKSLSHQEKARFYNNREQFTRLLLNLSVNTAL